jgi:hypothetical protein
MAQRLICRYLTAEKGLLHLILTAETQAHGPAPPILGPRVSDHGPLVLAVVNSFGGNFVWTGHLYSRTNFKLNRAAALAEWRQLLSA